MRAGAAHDAGTTRTALALVLSAAAQPDVSPERVQKLVGSLPEFQRAQPLAKALDQLLQPGAGCAQRLPLRRLQRVLAIELRRNLIDNSLAGNQTLPAHRRPLAEPLLKRGHHPFHPELVAVPALATGTRLSLA